MTRVSTNAGKHPYLRSDLGDLFEHIRNYEKGIPIDFTVVPKFNVVAETEYYDKKNIKIFYNDVVTYKMEKYKITYDSREHFWIMENIVDSGKRLKLRDFADSVLLIKKS